HSMQRSAAITASSRSQNQTFPGASSMSFIWSRILNPAISHPPQSTGDRPPTAPQPGRLRLCRRLVPAAQAAVRSLSPPDPPLTGGLPLRSLSPPDPPLTGGLPLRSLSPPDPPL